MEDLVAKSASQLLSDAPGTLQKVYERLVETKMTTPQGCTLFSRLVQELATYQQGAVVTKVLTQALSQSSPTRTGDSEDTNAASSFTFAKCSTELAHASLFCLVILSSSKAFARFCQEFKGVSEKLLCCFLENIKIVSACAVKEDASNTADYGAYHLAAACLDELTSHAAASESFRQLIRGKKEALPALLSLFEGETIKHLNDAVIKIVRIKATELLLDLALAKDSQEWMIEQGYFRLLASLCGAGIGRRFDLSEDGDFCVQVSVIIILRFIESPVLIKKMREARVLSLLQPYSSLLDSEIPRAWDTIRGLLTGRDRISRSRLPKTLGLLNRIVKRTNVDVPTVCSWEGCSEAESSQTSYQLNDVDFERYLKETKRPKLSKCGRCAAAYYCR